MVIVIVVSGPFLFKVGLIRDKNVLFSENYIVVKFSVSEKVVEK